MTEIKLIIDNLEDMVKRIYALEELDLELLHDSIENAIERAYVQGQSNGLESAKQSFMGIIREIPA